MGKINKNAFKLILIWIIVLSILYSLLSILRHNHFQSGGCDLGIYDQAVWQYSQFQYPYNTIKERFILGDHLTLTLPLLAPLFYLWNNVRILLIFQAFWISFSTLAIYKLCLKRGFTPLTSLNLSFVYSLFYGIQFAIFFDFHPVVIGVGLIAWLVYFLEANRKKLFLLTLLLLLLTQENMGIALFCLGLIYIFNKQYRRISLVFMVIGVLYGLAATKVISFFSPVGFQYTPELTFDPLKILTSFFDSEEKRLVWLYSLSWFVFLPLFSIGSILAVILDLSQYFVTGQEFSRMWSPFMHHRAILAPFLVLGTLEVFAFFKKRGLNLEKISLILVILALIQQYIFHFPLNKLIKPAYWQGELWMTDNQKLFQQIPNEVSLATQQNLAPHLSHRQEIYLVWPRQKDFENKQSFSANKQSFSSNNLCGQKTCWWLEFSGKPDYLVVDRRPSQWITQILESNENYQSAIDNMEKSGRIKLEKEVNFAKLYRINYNIILNYH